MSKAVLIVDDDASIRGLLRVMLRRAGFDTEEAANGRDAIDRIRSKKHDAIVLDLMMGPGSGVDVLHELHENRPGERCVVIVSAASERTIRELSDESIFAKLRKPFDIDEVVRTVQACCEH